MTGMPADLTAERIAELEARISRNAYKPSPHVTDDHCNRYIRAYEGRAGTAWIALLARELLEVRAYLNAVLDREADTVSLINQMACDATTAEARIRELTAERDAVNDAIIDAETAADIASFRSAVETIKLLGETASRATTAEAALAKAQADSDAQMLRVKACEHIALGDGDWERLRNECPSTAAVAGLRDAFAVKEAALAKARELIKECGAQFRFYESNHRAKNTAEGLEKAEVNARMAAKCDAALAEGRAGG